MAGDPRDRPVRDPHRADRPCQGWACLSGRARGDDRRGRRRDGRPRPHARHHRAQGVRGRAASARQRLRRARRGGRRARPQHRRQRRPRDDLPGRDAARRSRRGGVDRGRSVRHRPADDGGGGDRHRRRVHPVHRAGRLGPGVQQPRAVLRRRRRRRR